MNASPLFYKFFANGTIPFIPMGANFNQNRYFIFLTSRSGDGEARSFFLKHLLILEIYSTKVPSDFTTTGPWTF